MALWKTRHARRAWSWPWYQFWFETFLYRHFFTCKEWWNENFRISKCTFEHIVQAVGQDLAKKDFCLCFLQWLIGTNKASVVEKTWSIETDAIWMPQDVKYYVTASGYICHLGLGYHPKPGLITGKLRLLPWFTFYCTEAVFTMVSVDIYTHKKNYLGK